MVPCTIIAAAMLSVKSPKIFAESLADVRIYCEPQGSVEYAMVQRIDRVVGERFLRLLGLDWDFNELPAAKKLRISGTAHEFDYVTWIAHSLGSIISYNVVSDILHRVKEKETLLKEKSTTRQEKLNEADIILQHNLERVKTGLHRFYTIGSPLFYIYILFPGVLRPWEIDSKEEIEKSNKSWWINFFHAWDPVSTRLTQIAKKDETALEKPLIKRDLQKRDNELHRYFAIAEDRHSDLLRIPGKAHVDYWGDTNILKYIISRTYGKEVCKHQPHFLSNKKGTFWRNFLLVLFSVIIIAAIVAAIVWIVFGGGFMWLVRALVKWIKGLF